MFKATENEICTALAFAMFWCMYATDVQWFIMSVIAITMSEIAIIFSDYANAQVEFNIKYFQYLRDHKHDV